MKPVTISGNVEALSKSLQTGQEFMRFNFNFHTDITATETPAEAVLASLAKWSEAQTLSAKLVELIPENVNKDS